MSEFKRARNPKDKELRRANILEAAVSLFVQQKGVLPTTAQIGKQAGVAKGTLYLYFRSKEEIFLALLEDYQLNWFQHISLALGNQQTDILEVVDSACQYIEDNPLYFQLASLSSSIIEQNTDPAVLQAHKNSLAQQLKITAERLSETVPQLDVEHSANLIMRTYALLLGLWQISHSTDKISKVLKSPSLQALQPHFSSQARDALRDLWQGCLQAKNSPKKGVWKKLFS